MSNQQNNGTGSTTPRGLIIATWAVAVIPLAWGFINTMIKASKLFT